MNKKNSDELLKSLKEESEKYKLVIGELKGKEIVELLGDARVGTAMYTTHSGAPTTSSPIYIDAEDMMKIMEYIGEPRDLEHCLEFVRTIGNLDNENKYVMLYQILYLWISDRYRQNLYRLDIINSYDLYIRALKEEKQKSIKGRIL